MSLLSSILKFLCCCFYKEEEDYATSYHYYQQRQARERQAIFGSTTYYGSVRTGNYRSSNPSFETNNHRYGRNQQPSSNSSSTHTTRGTRIATERNVNGNLPYGFGSTSTHTGRTQASHNQTHYGRNQQPSSNSSSTHATRNARTATERTVNGNLPYRSDSASTYTSRAQALHNQTPSTIQRQPVQSAQKQDASNRHQSQQQTNPSKPYFCKSCHGNSPTNPISTQPVREEDLLLERLKKKWNAEMRMDNFSDLKW